MSRPVLYSFSSADSLIPALAEFIVKAQNDAVDKRGKFNVAISGGSLPKMLKGLIERPDVKWDRWHVFYADERVVPLDHDDSNHKLCMGELFSRVPIATTSVYAIDTSLLDDIQELTDSYERLLIKHFELKDGSQLPVFDLILLGMGPDGHTASLFPGHELLNETDRWVAYIEDSPKPPPKRITLTYPVINNAANVAFVSTGEGKQDMLSRILDRPEDGLPASRVLPKEPGKVYWFVDDAESGKTQYARTDFKA